MWNGGGQRVEDDVEILKAGLIDADRDAALGAVHRLVDSGMDP